MGASLVSLDQQKEEFTTSAQQASPFYIPSLDGIRAVSFMFVFLAHVFDLALGIFGVSVFFFLSGFLIATLLRMENDRYGAILLRKFYVRRVLRIFPPMYLTILFIIAASLLKLSPGKLFWQPLLASCTFVLNYVHIYLGHFPGGTPGLGPLWSLAVEEHFYLVFPAIFLAMNHWKWSYKKQAGVLSAACLLVLIWRLCLLLLFGENNYERLIFGTDTRIDMILFGCVMALVFNPVLDRNIRGSWLLIAIGATTIVLSLVFRNVWFVYAVRFTIQGFAFVPLFIGAITFEKSPLFVWLNFRPVRYLGTLSYTLYLIHAFFIITVRAHIPSTITSGVVALVLSICFAALMNRFVEKPMASLRKRFS